MVHLIRSDARTVTAHQNIIGFFNYENYTFLVRYSLRNGSIGLISLKRPYSPSNRVVFLQSSNIEMSDEDFLALLKMLSLYL